MKCSEMNELMMQYFDGEINDIDLYYFKQHLKGCMHCSEQYAVMTEVVEHVEKQAFLDPPKDFEECVMTSIKNMSVSKKHFIQSPMNIIYVLFATVFLMITTLAGIFLNSITIFDLVDIVLNNGFTVDMFNSILITAQNSYKMVVVLGNSMFDIYYVLLKNYYDVVLSLAAIIVIVYTMSSKMLKQQ